MPLSGASVPLQTSSLSLFSSSAPPSPCLSPSHAPPVAHPPPRPRRAQPAPKQKAASLRLFVPTLLADPAGQGSAPAIILLVRSRTSYSFTLRTEAHGFGPCGKYVTPPHTTAFFRTEKRR